MVLNYIENLFMLVSMVIGLVLFSAFALCAGIPIGIASFEVGLKPRAIAARIKKIWVNN